MSYPVSEKLIMIFNDSFERVSKNPSFLDKFYENFLGSSEEIREKFKHTDMSTQKVMLLKSLSYAMVAVHQPYVLYKTALRHSKSHLDIKPKLYLTWMDCMIKALEECDPMFNSDTEQAWREVMQPTIDYLINNYDY